MSREAGRQWKWRVLQLAIIAAVTWGVYRALAPELARLSWAELLRFQPAFGPLVLSTLVLVSVYLAHAFLWRLIMVDLGIARPTARDTIRVYFLASFGRYIPGKFWQLAGLAVLAARTGISPAGAAAAAVLGQFAFLTTGLLFLAAMLPRWAEGAVAFAGAAALATVAATAWVMLATSWGRRPQAWLIKRAPASLRPRLNSAFHLASCIRPGTAVCWAAAYGLTWLALGVAFSVFVAAFVPAAAVAPRQLAGTLAASYLWGYLMVVAPAGIGVREVAMGGLLARIPGFPIGAAVVVAIASRLWFTVAEILPLALLLGLPKANHTPASTERSGVRDAGRTDAN